MTKRLAIIVFLLTSLIALPSFMMAQNSRSLLRRGNSFYEDKKYKEAEINYRKAVEKDTSSVRAQYNLGNSLYKQDNYKEA